MTAVVLRGDARRLPLPDACADLIVTSPPYWQQRDYQDGGKSIPGQIGGEDDPAAWLKAMQDAAREWCRVLKPSGSIFVNLDDRYTSGGSMMCLPWQYAIGCTYDLGLILRKDIVWSKTNGLPGKARDRVDGTHEYLFHFVRSRRYYSDTDAVRVPHAAWTARAYEYEQNGYRRRDNPARMDRGGFAKPPTINPLGKIPGSVWTMTPEPLSLPGWLNVDHFAPMPMEMARRCVLGWSPPDGLVLDPFGGVGTTALVAAALGRMAVSVDLGHDYSRAARWRVTDPGELARARCAPKPPPVPDGQGSLFDGLEAS